jgi:hypothetical protein
MLMRTETSTKSRAASRSFLVPFKDGLKAVKQRNEPAVTTKRKDSGK